MQYIEVDDQEVETIDKQIGSITITTTVEPFVTIVNHTDDHFDTSSHIDTHTDKHSDTPLLCYSASLK